MFDVVILSANRLIDQTSPYLLQHATNPVHWQPWDESALAQARAQDKPLLLSIGYSACHWCHVMAHESFEDEATAALMNQHFVCIKIDREERPDLDKVYQMAFQMMNHRGGGWPLTVFATPDDLTPFYAGTYFPREPRYGMPDFKTVLDNVARYYAQHRNDVTRHAHALQDAFTRFQYAPAAAAPDVQTVLTNAENALVRQYDTAHGGFGMAPKFPRASALQLLLYAPDNDLRDCALHTLSQMGQGGVFDQIGGGFYRYSVDVRWAIPHFEKMLYDNGALLTLYAQALALTGHFQFLKIVTLTADWMLDTMRGEEGGFYASLDADSAGGEGQYYLWSASQLRALLGDDYALAEAYFGLKGTPNFNGSWHLNIAADAARLASLFDTTTAAMTMRLTDVRARLLAARDERIPPGRDDKVLAAWNGLAIEGLAVAGRVLSEPRWVDAAVKALDFAREKLWDNGQLVATYRNGHARYAGYLDDYACMATACLALLQTRWRTPDLHFATQLCEVLLAHFKDHDNGGFWFTHDNTDTPLARPRTFADEAMSSGNAKAAEAFLALGHLLGKSRYIDVAARTVSAAMVAMNDMPDAMCATLCVAREQLTPRAQVIVRADSATGAAWRQRIDAVTQSRVRVYVIDPQVRDLPGLLAQCVPQGDSVAYVCAGLSCSPPVTDLDALAQTLAGNDAYPNV